MTRSLILAAALLSAAIAVSSACLPRDLRLAPLAYAQPTIV
ncbi:hypothetical protein ABDK56_10630 [Sphingomonas sp. ASV193]